MELKGERRLGIDRAATWRALRDPEVMRACIPGCESVERVGDDEFKVAVAAALGPVRARFQGRILMEDVVEPASYTLRFEGQGGAAGFAKGTARVALDEEAGATTRLGYTVQAQVGGKLAQVGSRLIDSAALKLADEFFAAFEKQVGGVAAAPGDLAAAKAAGVPKWVYVLVALAAVVLGALLLR